jgi:hypothetical protein
MQTELINFYKKNENIEYHYPKKDNASKHWITIESGIPYLLLNLQGVPYLDMLQEAQSLDHLFVPHRDSESHSGWSSLCIHGISSQHTNHFKIYPEYQDLTEDKIPYQWTEIQNRCPVTVDYFKNYFPYDVYHRLRYMKLAPGGFITPHCDHTEVCLNAVNISLNNPSGCEFVFEDQGRIPFSNAGSTFLIANGIKHSVWNRSNIPRYHIIVHGYPTKKSSNFDNTIVDSYNILF